MGIRKPFYPRWVVRWSFKAWRLTDSNSESHAYENLSEARGWFKKLATGSRECAIELWEYKREGDGGRCIGKMHNEGRGH